MQVLDVPEKEVLENDEKNVLESAEKEVVKEAELTFKSHGDLSFDDLMNELEEKEKRGEDIYEGLYDTESDIKVIKKYQPSKVSHDAEITFEGHGSSSDSGLRSMPDDDLVSLTGFSDQLSEEDSDKTLHASADMPTHSDSLSHSHELGVLLSRIDQLEDNLSKKVSEEIKSSVPSLVADSLKDQLPSLLAEALKVALPQMVKTSVSESITEEIPQIHAQLEKNLHEQLPTVLLKPMYKEFNAFNKLESQRFVMLESHLTKVIHKSMKKSIHLRVRKGMKEVRDKLSWCTSTIDTNSQLVRDMKVMFHDMVAILESAEVFKKANAEGEKWEKNNPEMVDATTQTPEQVQGEQSSDHKAAEVPPTVNTERALVIHPSETHKEGSSDEDKDDYVPLAKRFKIIPTTAIPSPKPLMSVLHDPLKFTEAAKMTYAQFADHLAKTTKSAFSPIPPKAPTPSKVQSKDKKVATEEPVNQLVSFMEESGSAPKTSSFKSFANSGMKFTQEELVAQAKEIQRLADLKTENEKNEEALQKLLRNQASIEAQKQKMAEHEANRSKMLREYNDCLNQRVDERPITKISYRILSSKEASMRITRGNNPLDVIVYPNFKLKTLGFSEWLEVHALASKMKGKAIDLLLQSLRAKFDWVTSRAKALGIPPPSELTNPAESKKRKRTADILKEVFVQDDVVVDGMHRNLVPPPGVTGMKGLVITEPEHGIFYLNGNFDLVFQRISKFHLATTPQLIRLQQGIIRGTPDADAVFNQLEFEIEARNDAAKAREIVKDNLDGMGQFV